MLKGSRLLVVVEDTAATRVLWPVWRLEVLEPFLHKLEDGAFGDYELNFVAFASIDSPCNGRIRSGNWTQSVERFRCYFDRLTFEGSSCGTRLCEALVEATYLSREPSSLGNVKQHVLVCTAGSSNPLPIQWTCEHHQLRSIGSQPNDILAYMTSLSMSISFLPGFSSNGTLLKSFEFLVGSRAVLKCQELSKGKRCLALLHPNWRHGFMSVFPECREIPEPIEKTASLTFPTDSSSSKSTLSFEDGTRCEPVREAVEKLSQNGSPKQAPSRYLMNESPKPTSTFNEVIDLSNWQKPKERTQLIWNLEESLDSELDGFEAEFESEKELLGLEIPSESERDRLSEKESKVESVSSYTTPAMEIAFKPLLNPLAGPPVQIPLPDDTTASSYSQRISIKARRNQTHSSSVSVSIDNREDPRSLEEKRTDSDFDDPCSTQPVLDASDRRRLQNVERCLHDPIDRDLIRSYRRDAQSDRFFQSGADDEQHEAKRLRTNYRNSPQIKQTTIEKQRSTPSIVVNPRPPSCPFDDSQRTQPQRRGILPAGGFGYNVEWSGPLYLAGPIIRQSEAQKLFNIQILCNRTLSNLRKCPKELVVHEMKRKEEVSFEPSCTVNINWDTLTEMGRTFGKWLTENNMVAIVDLLDEIPSRLIISIQDTSNPEECHLVAGFLRGWERL